jgi:hypothetical protein
MMKIKEFSSLAIWWVSSFFYRINLTLTVCSLDASEHNRTIFYSLITQTYFNPFLQTHTLSREWEQAENS